MGKPTGFLEFQRKVGKNKPTIERIQNYNEFHEELSYEEQIIQGARCMNCGVPFCQSGIMLNGMVTGCPLNNLIPEFNDLIYKDNVYLALDRLLKTNPFPEFTGRVCPAPCESACTVSINTPSVTIKENEKFIIDFAFKNGYIKPNTPNIRKNKRIAVIGSGPSGLSCAYYLNQYGYSVDVFEREDRIGGLLTYGIPNMKLDKNIVDRRINILKEEGISFYTNSNPCINEKLKDKILNEYDAIVLATGATKPRDLNVNGRESKGIYFAVDYLKENTRRLLNNYSNENYINCKNKNVLIIGGGDTGTDCVGTSIRQGCKSVVQIEITNPLPQDRLDSNPWPEWKRTLKTDYGQEEAIDLFGKDPRRYSTSVKEFLYDSSLNIVAAKLVKVKLEKDKMGNSIFIEIKGSEEIINVDIVLIAMGFLGTEESIFNSFKVEVDKRNNIKASYDNFKTNKEKIFTCGDARRGQSLVVLAIKEGLDAAKSINEYLNLK